MRLSKLELTELAGNTLEALDFVREKSVTEKDVTYIFGVLDGNTSVKTLTIEECNMTDSAVIKLAECLQDHPYITRLHLAGNQITNQGLRALMSVPHLEYISVAFNNVSSNIVREVLARDPNKPIILTGNPNISASELGQMKAHFKQTARPRRLDAADTMQSTLTTPAAHPAAFHTPKRKLSDANHKQPKRHHKDQNTTVLDAELDALLGGPRFVK